MSSEGGKRVLAFARSVLPAERAHFLLLFGATFLFVAHSLRWWMPLQPIARWPSIDAPGIDFSRWVSIVATMALPMWVAGAAAGFVCLMPANKLLRRLVLTVLRTVAQRFRLDDDLSRAAR
jgi:hypothetical protein